MPKTFLLTDEFPPVQTGIARLMGEIARRYPKGELLVSTGQHRDASRVTRRGDRADRQHQRGVRRHMIDDDQPRARGQRRDDRLDDLRRIANRMRHVEGRQRHAAIVNVFV